MSKIAFLAVDIYSSVAFLYGCSLYSCSISSLKVSYSDVSVIFCSPAQLVHIPLGPGLSVPRKAAAIIRVLPLLVAM